jgi:Ribbon-helix-helix protein, copG family
MSLEKRPHPFPPPLVEGGQGAGNSEAFRRLDEEMVELSLLIPSSQAGTLEEEARRQGLSAGELVRGLIREFLLCQALWTRN